ncbi:MAG: FAD-binding protein [Chloroflexi bacterium]|nr:FAD-binding protein [Chloroflexota bacterium]
MLDQNALQSLTQIVDKRRIITDAAEMVVYETDATADRGTPDLIVFPESAEQVSRIMRWAAEHQVPIVARGAGTGLSGGAVAEHGGIIIEFSNFNRVLEFDTVGRSVVAQVGVVNQALDNLMKTQGLYFPPDPASGRSATIGGNVAENAGGPHCFKYGVTSNYVTGLQVVLVDGRIVRLGGRAFDYPEYDLTALMTGSEGTLGVIIEMDARIVRNPPGVKTMMAAFDDVETAGRAVSAVIATGLVPATMEMIDKSIMRIVEDYLHIGLPVHTGAMLIVEVDGYHAGLDAQMDEVIAVLEHNGAREMRVAKTAEERDQIWYGRKSSAGAFARIAPEKFTIDCTVPRSRIADMLSAINEICLGLELKVGYILHAGDGNLHPNIPFFPSDKSQVERGWKACEQIMKAAVARDGSITGEHGVGIEKREWLAYMCDGAELSAMCDVKQVFDPKNLLNPGKIFPSKLPEVQRVTPLANVPTDIFAPQTADEAACGLVALSNAKQKVSINAKRNYAVTLSTRSLNKIIKYAPDDLYVTVGAGITLEELQALLAKDGWQVPLVSPWRESTVGGIVATNLNSPQRMRYGSVRDVMLSTRVALTDGRVVRAGRVVVKNVAGYDLPKVFVGSHGTLGLLTEVTFKLVKVARAKKTLLVPIDDLKSGLALSSQLLQVALTASAIVLGKGIAVPGVSSSYVLAYTAEGFPIDVESEMNQVRELLDQTQRNKAIDVELPTGTDLWLKLLSDTTTDSMVVRVGVAPKDVGKFAVAQSDVLASSSYLIDVPSGLTYAVSSPKEVELAKIWLDGLRIPALAAGGYAAVMQMANAWHGKINQVGYRPDTIDLQESLKSKWDPTNTLV